MKPEDKQFTEPFWENAAELAGHLLAEDAFVYTKSCECCGHWFLFQNYPMEVMVSSTGRALKVYGLSDNEPFMQMLVPDKIGRLEKYLFWFLANVPAAWAWVRTHGVTYTLDYKLAPGHNVPPRYLVPSFVFHPN